MYQIIWSYTFSDKDRVINTMHSWLAWYELISIQTLLKLPTYLTADCIGCWEELLYSISQMTMRILFPLKKGVPPCTVPEMK